MLISDPENKPQIVVFSKKKGLWYYIRQYYIVSAMVLMIIVLGIWIGAQLINVEVESNYDTIQQLPSAASTVAASMQPENMPSIQSSMMDNTIVLQKGHKVLFFGDKMMQGIAPYIKKWLESEYQIESMDFSQSDMGLASPESVNWLQHLEQILEQDKDLKLIVILFGINDARDLQSENLTFKTNAWEVEYISRIKRILQAAQSRGVKVMWLGVPHMQDTVLNEQMAYLDGLFARELATHQNHVLWLKTSDLLSDGQQNYQDSMVLDGETVKIRAPNGIDLTERGQQFMADYIASYLSIERK